MKKTFMGVKLRKLRSERGLSQIALAQALGLSPSYLNQLEQNQRPLTVSVLLKLNKALDVDIQQFSEDEESRLIAGLREALAGADEPISLPEMQEVAAQMPALGRAVLAMHQRNLEMREQLELLSLQFGDGRTEAPPARAAMPFEVVRDFFFAHQNYFDALDRAAESCAAALQRQQPHHGASRSDGLVQRLAGHGIRVEFIDTQQPQQSKRLFDAARRTLTLASRLDDAQRAFQLATQLALVEYAPLIDALVQSPPLLNDPASHKLARIGLANYFAGALLLPYNAFLEAAEELRYDIELLQQRFDVGFETICHRLSTLQRPGLPGVPFFFIRVDRAGNISKRQSATHFHFSRTGGTCPLWNVYEAFGRPEHTLAQLASMPDGRRYLWIARSVSRGQRGYGSPRQTFSIGLGCDIRHAPRLVYAQGLDLQAPEAATPIGMGCKVCERDGCPQRAFPYVGRALDVDENHSRFSPYGFARTEAALAGRSAPALNR